MTVGAFGGDTYHGNTLRWSLMGFSEGTHLAQKSKSMFGSFFKKPKPDQHFEMNLPHIEPGEHSELVHPDPKVEPVPPNPVGEPAIFSPHNIALIAIFLMLLAGGLGMRACLKLGELEKTRQTETVQHESVLDSLVRVKTDLSTELENLQASFYGMSLENDSLAERLARSTNILEEKDRTIQEIRGKSLREERVLRTQVQQLQTLKDRYETIIAILTNKNAALSAENARLRGTADSLSGQVSDLGQRLAAQIQKTQSAQFKATAFRVEMARRNDKLTTKARRTRELTVLFELNNVPPEYQGDQKIYLAITDDRGVPIASKNPIYANIKGEKGVLEIVAQAFLQQMVAEKQSLSMVYRLDDKLKKGTYVVSVYSEKGLLGVATFRLA